VHIFNRNHINPGLFVQYRLGFSFSNDLRHGAVEFRRPRQRIDVDHANDGFSVF
jgi:hypothetical protein